jgi:hypothetical protein
VLDPGTCCAHKKVCRCDALDGTEPFRFASAGVTVNLRGIEHPRCARDKAFAVIAGIVGIGVRLEHLVEDDKPRLFVSADLGTKLRASRNFSVLPIPRG